MYYGKSDNYKRETTDFSEKIRLHDEEFKNLELQSKETYIPKYILKSSDIIELFNGLGDTLYDVYSSQESQFSGETIQNYIKSELTRISLIFFGNIPDMKVDFSDGNIELERNSKEEKLLIKKYNESYIGDLIDTSKSSLKAYLYNYLHDTNISTYMSQIESKEDDKSSFIASNSEFSMGVRSSSRLQNKRVERIHRFNKQYSAVFFNNE